MVFNRESSIEQVDAHNKPNYLNNLCFIEWKIGWFNII